MQLYDLYVFPSIPGPDGRYELRISRTLQNAFMIGLDSNPLPGRTVLRLDRHSAPIQTLGDFVQRMNDEDGDFVADSIEVEFLHSWRYGGTLYTGGTETGVVGENVATTDGCTFLDALFDDEEVTYWAWLVRYTGEEREIYFAGIIKPADITRGHGGIIDESTVTELAQSRPKIRINPTGRLKEATCAGIVTGATSSDMMTGGLGVTLPWYAGLATDSPVPTTADPNDPGYGEFETLSEWDAHLDLLVKACYGLAEQAAIDGFRTNDDFFPENVWGVSLAHIVFRIAQLGGFFPAEDLLECAFEFTEQPFVPGGPPGVGVYSETPITDPVQQLIVSFNHAFGVSSYTGTTAYEYPCSWKRDTPLSTVLRDICFQLGCYIDLTVRQFFGDTEMRLISRRKNRGPLPSAWKMIAGSSSEQQRQVSKEYVEIKNRGFDTAVRCPAGAVGEGISIEIPFGTRPMGNKELHTFTTDRCTIDPRHGTYAQRLAFIIPDETQVESTNADSWVLGSYLYSLYETAAVNRYYPDGVDPVLADDWRGFYVLRSCTEKPGVYTNRDNTLVALAQFYARELLGDRVLIEREYRGVLADDGTIQGVKPGIEATWRVRGALRTFRGVEIRRNVIAGTTKILWKEKPADYDAVNDLPYEIIAGASGSTTGGGSSTNAVVNSTNASGVTIGGAGVENYIPVYTDIKTLGVSRMRQGTDGVMNIAGRTADLLPALYAGSSESGYVVPGITGESNSAAGVEGVSSSGAGVKGTSTSGAAVEAVGLLKATTLQVTAGAAIDKWMKSTGSDGTGAWTVLPAMGAASALAGGTAGLVPASAAGDQGKFLRADATWESPGSGGDVRVRCVVTRNFSGASEVPNGIPASGDADGITLTGEEKVLVIQEDDQTLIGTYIVAAGPWSRSSDTITAGMQVQVMFGGTTYGSAVFHCRNATDPVIGVDNITFGVSKAIPLTDSVSTPAIVDGAVTNAKLRDSAALSVIGRSANSSGDPADIAAANDAEVLRRNGTTLGFGTVATDGIADNAITDTKLRDSVGLSVVGRSANSTGDPGDIAAGTDGYVLRQSGTTLAFGQVATAGIADNAVTDDKLRDSVGLTVIGRASNSTGNPADITAANDAEVLRRSGTSIGFGQVATGGIADGAVTGAKLGADIELDGVEIAGWFVRAHNLAPIGPSGLQSMDEDHPICFVDTTATLNGGVTEYKVLLPTYTGVGSIPIGATLEVWDAADNAATAGRNIVVEAAGNTFADGTTTQTISANGRGLRMVLNPSGLWQYETL